MNKPKFTANNSFPTHVFTPMSNAQTVSKVLSLKQLRFDIDQSTGKRRSKDGRKPNPNSPLAEAISYRYGYFEPVHVNIRAISSTEQNAGMINFNEFFAIRSDDILNLIISLKNAGVIIRYTNYGTCIYIELNPNAKRFYDKEFAQLHVLNCVNKKHALVQLSSICVLSKEQGQISLADYVSNVLAPETNDDVTKGDGYI